MNNPKSRDENSDKLDRRRGQAIKTENSVGLRILARLSQSDHDIAWLSEVTKLPQNTLRDYVQGGVKKSDAAVAIAHALDVSVDWLLTGNAAEITEQKLRALLGAMDPVAIVEELFPQKSLSDQFSEYTAEPGWRSGVVDLIGGASSASASTTSVANTISIPALKARASAGDGSLLWGRELGEGPFRFAEAWLRRKFGSVTNLRLIQIRGDSQLPDLSDGDWAIIDTAQNKLENGLAVIRLDECLMIKRLQREGHFVQLISRNPIYAPTVLDLSKEEERIQGIGKVVYIFKSV